MLLAVDGSPPIRIGLSAPNARVEEMAEPPEHGNLQGWTVAEVSAPIDDRRFIVRFERPGTFRGSPVRHATLEVSLVPTARGALLSGGASQRLAALGAALPAAATPRPLLTPDEIAQAVTHGNQDLLLSGRWMSPMLARWLVRLGEARAIEAYQTVCTLPAPQPARCGGQLVAFAWCDDAETAPSLIEPAPTSSASEPSHAPSRRARALERMRDELAHAANAPRWRQLADALMMLGDLPAPETVRLPDGSLQTVPARTGERSVDTAERLYRDVRSMERALERLPDRIARVELAAALERPTADGRVKERGVASAAAAESPVARPYRSYRSSGGLEIRVGRGAAANDQLTFHYASPNDVWLHARDAAGAHVVLRWTRNESPPARDLEEAAMLAAWHSRMRSSTLVPVDWTRRKYVRKGRGDPPGRVRVERARTVFVRPDAALERALRVER